MTETNEGKRISIFHTGEAIDYRLINVATGSKNNEMTGIHVEIIWYITYELKSPGPNLT